MGRGRTGSRRPKESNRGLSAAYVSEVLAVLLDARRSVRGSCGSGADLCAHATIGVRCAAVM